MNKVTKQVITKVGQMVDETERKLKEYCPPRTVLCPVCWHEETLRALRQHSTPIRDELSVMRWCRPEGGVRGQIVTIWDDGHWRCEVCGINFPACMAAMMIDAVLRVSDPSSSVFDEDSCKPAEVASKGGRK